MGTEYHWIVPYSLGQPDRGAAATANRRRVAVAVPPTEVGLTSTVSTAGLPVKMLLVTVALVPRLLRLGLPCAQRRVDLLSHNTVGAAIVDDNGPGSCRIAGQTRTVVPLPVQTVVEFCRGRAAHRGRTHIHRRHGLLTRKRRGYFGVQLPMFLRQAAVAQRLALVRRPQYCRCCHRWTSTTGSCHVPPIASCAAARANRRRRRRRRPTNRRRAGHMQVKLAARYDKQ